MFKLFIKLHLPTVPFAKEQKVSNYHQYTIMKLALIFLYLTRELEACFLYSSTNYRQLGLLGDDRFHYSGYWRLPPATPEDAEDEAVMLIGGTVCFLGILLLWNFSYCRETLPPYPMRGELYEDQQ